jgi:plasmid segregation protein ParM
MSKSVTIPVAAVDVGYRTTKFTLGSAESCSSFLSIAARVTHERATTVGVEKLDGVTINVNGNDYFVGPDAQYRSNGRDALTVLDKFSTSEEYTALTHGALHYIAGNASRNLRDVSTVEIQHLVAGLPLNTHKEFHKLVRDQLVGRHEIAGRTIEIKKATVVMQPQGALVAFTEKNKSAAVRETNSLVLDLGGGTFDWFLSLGIKPVFDRSGAHPKGMLACVFYVCDKIKAGLRNDPLMVERVDKAIRSGAKTVKVAGQDWDLEPHMAGVRAILQECINVMLASVANLDVIDQIVITGGGGELLREELEAMMPAYKHMMRIEPDPVFANVRGFHLIGVMVSNQARK